MESKYVGGMGTGVATGRAVWRALTCPPGKSVPWTACRCRWTPASGCVGVGPLALAVVWRDMSLRVTCWSYEAPAIPALLPWTKCFPGLSRLPIEMFVSGDFASPSNNRRLHPARTDPWSPRGCGRQGHCHLLTASDPAPEANGPHRLHATGPGPRRRGGQAPSRYPPLLRQLGQLDTITQASQLQRQTPAGSPWEV